MLGVSRGRLGLLEKVVPGYEEKLWARVPREWKQRKIEFDLRSFSRQIESHKQFQSWFVAYKEAEAKWTPSERFRKPAVDWRRQLTRGTLFYGRPMEGPRNTDYRPRADGQPVFDRLTEISPFSTEEWQERRRHRTFDGLKLAATLYALFLGNRLLTDTPVIWC